MPVARKGSPPPQAIKQTVNVMDSLNAWTTDEDQDEDPDKKPKVPLGYTPLAQSDKNAPTEGWRLIFDSESDSFNAVIGIVIIANAIVIGLETDLGREHFTVCCEYFTTPAYLFDCTLVLSGTLDLWILPLVSHGKQNVNSVGYQFSVLRLLRILRLLRVLRVIRVFRMFGQLLLIVKAFGKSLQVVLLLSILVFIMHYAMGIVCTQLIGHQAHKWGDNADGIEQWFGDIPTSMTTLFWVMFGSGWDPLLDLLTQVYPTGLVLFAFAVYMVITVAMLALIVGLISESLIIAQQEFKTRTMDKFAIKKKILATEYTEELNALLEDEMDEFGAVEARDLKQAVKGDANLITKLIGVGVTLTLEGLMGLVDSMSLGGSQKVGIDHFIEKVTNLNGGSTASAVVDVKFDILKSRQKMDAIDAKMDLLMTKLGVAAPA